MKQVITTEKIPIKLWLNDIEDGALQQAKNLANLPFAVKHIAIMADSHLGYGMPIGGVMATKDVVVPNCVGVDIGCGVIAIKSNITLDQYEDIETLQVELKDWMQLIRETIPVGFKHNDHAIPSEIFDTMPDIPILNRELSSAKKQLGTLGGGNHFIEIQKDEEGYIWVMIHSGSRNLGKQVADTYHAIAKKCCAEWYSQLPNTDLSFLPLDMLQAQEYLTAMNFCKDFGKESRWFMLRNIIRIIGEKYFNTIPFDIAHNYAAMENHFGHNVLVHRKGATLAREGTIGIIPGSMGTNSYIVRGLGNPESFNSCSHGAGRRMGRAEAIRSLSLEEEQKKMEKIIGGPRSRSELDEAPGAYKDIESVMGQQSDLVEIVTKLTPLCVVKG